MSCIISFVENKIINLKNKNINKLLDMNNLNEYVISLEKISKLCQKNKFSGRFLRKLPVLSITKFFNQCKNGISLKNYLKILNKTVQEEIEQKKILEASTNSNYTKNI